jgi:hypothetical protein
MLTNLGIKPMPFFTLTPYSSQLSNNLHSYKGWEQVFCFSFYLNTILAFDSVQGSIFPYKQFYPWEFCKPYFLELSCYIIVPLLNAYLRLDGLIIFSTGGDPLKNMGTSSM